MTKVIIYSKPFCPYCSRAKALLQSKGVVYEEIDISSDPELRKEMIHLSGGHTVPQIFINDNPIGGCDELHALESASKLDSLL